MLLNVLLFTIISAFRFSMTLNYHHIIDYSTKNRSILGYITNAWKNVMMTLGNFFFTNKKS